MASDPAHGGNLASAGGRFGVGDVVQVRGGPFGWSTPGRVTRVQDSAYEVARNDGAKATGVAEADLRPGAPAEVRDGDLHLRPGAHDALQRHLKEALASREFLRKDLMRDPLEARTFAVDVNKGNVASHLELRMRLLERVMARLEAEGATETENETPLKQLYLEECDLFKAYIPLTLLIHKRYEEYKSNGRPGAFVVGINAPPGSGKSTLIQILIFVFRVSVGEGLRVAQIGSDDLYMNREQRVACGIEPPTRLDPRSLDPAYSGILSRLKHLKEGEVARVPRFNKGLDRRVEENHFSCVPGPLDVLFYEGWRVGVPPGEFRGPGHAEAHPFNYSAFNAPIDFLVFLAADPKVVFDWKLQSSRSDFLNAAKRDPSKGAWTQARVDEITALWDGWMLPFYQQHEEKLARLPAEKGGADLVITKEASHHIAKVEGRKDERLMKYYKHLALSSNRARLKRPAVKELLVSNFGKGETYDALSLMSPHRSEGSDEVIEEEFVWLVDEMMRIPGLAASLVWHRTVTCESVGGGANAPSGTFRCAVLNATALDPAQAAAALRAELGGRPSLTLAYAAHPAQLEALAPRLEGAVVGCTSCGGVLAGAKHVGGGAAIFAIRDNGGVYVGAQCAPSDSMRPEEAWHNAAAEAAGDALGRAAELGRRNTPPALVLLHCTSGHEERAIEGVASVLPGARIFGGSAAAGENNSSATWRILSGRTVVSIGVSVTLLYPSVPCRLQLNCLHRDPDVACEGEVTEAEGRRVLTIDGRPAGDVYAAWAGGAVQNRGTETLTTLNPLARDVVEDFGGRVRQFLLHPHADPCGGGGLGLFAEVAKGQRLRLMRSTRSDLVLSAARATENLRRDVRHSVAGALVVYCAGCAMELRRGATGQLDKLGEAIAGALPEGTPLVGMFPLGEQGPAAGGGNCHANLMYNLLLFDC